jgi:hypothetical protein
MALDISSYLDQFEQQGASLSKPVLPEGNYQGNLTAVTLRSNKVTPTKGQNAGKETVLANWGFKVALVSETAQQVMKQDNDVIVYGDSDTETCKGTLNLTEIGIDFHNNVSFWNFVGGIFAQVGLATKEKDDGGAVSFKIERTILDGIYSGTEETAADYQAAEDFDALMLPAKLAELQINNVSELITAEANTKKVYVHLSRRNNYKDKTLKEHFIKKLIMADVFEASETSVASLVN